MPLTTDSDTWVLVNLRMLNVSITDSGTWVLVNLRMLDVSTTDSGTKVLVNLRMLDVSHNRLRYLGLVNLRMLDVSSALSRIFLRRCTLNARKGLQRQILCRLCKSRAVLFCAESFILILFVLAKLLLPVNQGSIHDNEKILWHCLCKVNNPFMDLGLVIESLKEISVVIIEFSR